MLQRVKKPFDTLLQTAEEDGRDFFAALAVREEAAENLVTAVFSEAVLRTASGRKTG